MLPNDAGTYLVFAMTLGGVLVAALVVCREIRGVRSSLRYLDRWARRAERELESLEARLAA